MADITNKRLNIYIDQSSAQQALETLQKRADKLTESIDKGKVAGKSMATEIAKLKDTETAIKGVQNQIDNGLAPSIRQQEGAVRKLRNEIVKFSGTAKDLEPLSAKYKEQNALLAKMREETLGVQKAQQQMTGGSPLTKMGVAAGALIGNVYTTAAIMAIDVFKTFITINKEFEQSVANLSAITGATGADLNFLKNAAIGMSRTSINSAKDFVEAMKLIGSAKPELLASKEGLVEVTKAAALLADASGLALPDAATRLTDALNQFGEPARMAGKYVDALAAASKYGAAEVPNVTEALLQFGSIAKQSNISIYESSAAIELLGEKGIKGAEAGTKLRNIFLRLSATDALPPEAKEALERYGVNTDILSNKSLSLEKRFVELSKVSGDASALFKIFGEQNINAGQIILQNIPRYAELAKQVKEIGVAGEQAKTNTDTLSAAWDRLGNKVNAEFLQNGGAFTNFLKSITNAAGDTFTILSKNYDLAYKIATFDFIGLYNLRKDSQNSETEAANEKVISGLLDHYSTDKEGKARSREDVLANLRQNGSYAYKKMKDAEAAGDTKHLLQYYNNYKNTMIAVARVRDEVLPPTQKELPIKPKVLLDKKEETEKQRILKDLQKLHEEATKSAMTADEKEIESVVYKYAEIMKAAVKHHISIKQATEDRDLEISEIEKKQSAKAEKEKNEEIKKIDADNYQESLKFTQDRFEAMKLIEAKRLVDGKINKKQYEYNIKAIDEASKGEQLETAISFSSVVKKAAEDVTKFKIDLLKDETVAVIAAAQAQEAETELIKKLVEQSEEADLDRKLLLVQKGSDAELVLLIQKLNRERKIKLAAIEKDRQEALKGVVGSGANADAQRGNINTASDSRAAGVNAQFDSDKKTLETSTVVKRIKADLQYAQQALGVLDQFNQAATARENAALQKELAANNKRKKGVEDLVKNKTITEIEGKKRLAEIDLESEKKKADTEKKQNERNKRMAIAQAVVNGALAITSILAEYPKFDGGFAMFAALGVAIATTAAQVGIISSQKFAKGGIAQGASHSEGGIKLYDTKSQQVVGEMEGSEPYMILSKNFRRNNPDFIAAALDSSINRNGARITLPQYQTRSYRPIDFTGIASSLGNHKFATGGVFGGGTISNQSGSEELLNKMADLIAQNTEVMAYNTATTARLNGQLNAGIKASVSLNALDDARTVKDNILSEANP